MPPSVGGGYLSDTFARLRIALAGRYAVEEEIGRGGTAVVFRAQDLKHRRLVALKILRPEVSAILGPDRFLREIEIAAGLSHPHILPLHDSGSADGFLYFVMPLVEGESLRARLSREPQLPLAAVLQTVLEVADALSYAHSRGIVHRDIKPENILLAEGHAVVADFGIARALSAAAGETSTTSGVALGTPAYMSPEQASGGPVDARTDVYALGCVVYEMLSGKPPFRGPAELLSRQASPTLRSARRNLPAYVTRAVETALAISPDERFASAADFSAALSGTGARRLPARQRRFWRRMAIPAAAVGVLTLLGLIWKLVAGGLNFAERDWILVADFDGPPDDPGLATAVRELTTTELNQSSFLSTLSRQQLNATMRSAGIPETTRVGPELAGELAVRSALRAVLLGSILPLGKGNYSIVLHVLDAESGADLTSVAGAATDSSLIGAVQGLAREVRERLGEHRGAIEANLPLDQVATPSFPAFRRYVEALELQNKGDGHGSNRLLREALAADTGFASAWYLMGWNYINERMLDSAGMAFAEAVRRPDRLGARRYRVEADVSYTQRYDLPAAIRAYDLYLEHFPKSFAVRNNRGLYLIALDRYEDALAEFQRAVEVHPFGRRQAQIQLANLAATQIALGRTREAREEARDLTGPFAQYLRIMLAVATDGWDEADSVASRAASDPSSPTWLRTQATAAAASALAARGQVAAADRALEAASETATQDAARWYHRARLLLATASEHPVGRPPQSLTADSTAAGRVTRGLWAALNGDTVAARGELRHLARFPSAELVKLGQGSLLVQAWIEARAGRWAEVTRLIGPAAREGEHDTSLLDRVGSLSLRWLAAEAYERQGQLDSALATFALVVRPLRMPGLEFAQRGLVVSFAHRRLAQLHQRMGLRDAARREWDLFLATLTNPEPELLPWVAAARAGERKGGGMK